MKSVWSMLVLVGAVGFTGCAVSAEEPSQENASVAEPQMKGGGGAGGGCHVTFGGYTLIVAGTYSSDGSCCGKTLCTENCGGQKYVDVCIDCGADPDVKCGDGHQTVSIVRNPNIAATTQAWSTLKP